MYEKLLAGQSCYLYKGDQKKWTDIHSLIGRNGLFVDRYAKMNHFPISTVVANECQFPVGFNHSKRLSYEEICLKHASEIFEKCEKLNKKIHLLYSGGIDSTLILVLLLKTIGLETLKNNLVICLNERSISENPNFYYRYILPHFKMVPSSHVFYLLNEDNIILTGEMNDPLFGNYLSLFLDLNLGDDFCKQKLSESSIRKLLLQMQCSTESAHYWSDVLYAAAYSQNEVELRDLHDYLWWFNFVYRWQAIYFGLILRTPQQQFQPRSVNKKSLEDTFIHFYSSQDFQIWSLQNRELTRYEKWIDYKKIAKKIIYDFDKNSVYFFEKTKAASLNYMLFAKPVAKSIDWNYHFTY